MVSDTFSFITRILYILSLSSMICSFELLCDMRIATIVGLINYFGIFGDANIIYQTVHLFVVYAVVLLDMLYDCCGLLELARTGLQSELMACQCLCLVRIHG